MEQRSRVASQVSTRIKALLAGALVLGVGGSVTVAAWTDGTFAQGSFGTSVFDVESNVSKPYSAAAPWSDAATAPGSTLVFSATAMSPNVSFYAPIGIRGKVNSTGGTIAVQIPVVTGSTALSSAMQYRVVRSATCAADAFTAGAAYVVGSASTYSSLTAGQNSGVVTSVAAATSSSVGAATQFCLEVRLPTGAPNTLQGLTATVSWRFDAVSTD